MKKQPGGIVGVEKLSFITNSARMGRLHFETAIGHFQVAALGAIATLVYASAPAAVAQSAALKPSAEVAIHGRVTDSASEPVAAATVKLEQEGVSGTLDTKSDGAGVFAFSALKAGHYFVSAEKLGQCTRVVAIVLTSPSEQKHIDLVLENSAACTRSNHSLASSTQEMEFADKPSFTVAGVTDWTAAGGHGSDTSLRASEALTRETLTLKNGGLEPSARNVTDNAIQVTEIEFKLRSAVAGSPESFLANRQLGEFYLRAGRYRESIPLLETSYRVDPANRENEYDLAQALKAAGDNSRAREHVQRLMAHRESADLCRLAGELDEALGDPLAAVREFERAVRLDSSEQNYFEWGSELLLHRAVLQSQQVFAEGAKAYPKSARMLAALGTALFAGAHYEEAAQRLCDASDLNPSDPEPYIFMGKIEIAAPNPLACVERKLARFAKEQPGNSLANYFYAMALWKGQTQPAEQSILTEVEDSLLKAVTLDANCADAYLQLGILYSSQHSLEKAIGYYSKAIEANPELAEAHYRLGAAYDRIGETAKAKREFQLHDEIKKRQAAEVERQRREVKQFLVGGQPTFPTAR